MKKTIVVAGAGRGLGNGVAEKFGGNDFRVILMARNEEHLKEYAADFSAKGIYIGTVQVTGAIGSNDFYAPKTIAEEFWKLYDRRETHEIVH